uniref:HMA domain-containing protein n=1 Tax=Aegilops tauschii TaxID=37682 RepID=M8C0E4_AEGTA
MTSEPETPRITELHVRMDCNGCVHKIRKTLSGIDGVGEHIVVAIVLAHQSTDMGALLPKKEDATTIQRLLGEEEMGARSLRCSARRIPTHAA